MNERERARASIWIIIKNYLKTSHQSSPCKSTQCIIDIDILCAVVCTMWCIMITMDRCHSTIFCICITHHQVSVFFFYFFYSHVLELIKFEFIGIIKNISDNELNELNTHTQRVYKNIHLVIWLVIFGSILNEHKKKSLVENEHNT